MTLTLSEAENLLSSQTIPDTALIPLHTFPIQDEFIFRHENGTEIELYNEQRLLQDLNERQQQFRSWVIAPLDNLTTAFTKPWLLLVQTPESLDMKGFPTTTDRFRIDMVSTVKRMGDEYSLVHLPATRIPNPFESVETMQHPRISVFAAFKVDVPRSWINSAGDNVELDLMSAIRIGSGTDVTEIALRESDCQLLTIEWDVMSVTFEAELDALRYFVNEKKLKDKGPTMKSQRAFHMIQNFHSSWKDFYDLHKDFPQLNNPNLAKYGVPTEILQRYNAFNEDHLRALNGLQQIPNGLYFVNGCPGSGKTEWNMILAGLIQCSMAQKRRKRRAPILFLVDINKAVDDAAKRYYSLCHRAGVKLRIVRMHGWPLEMRESAKLNASGATAKQDNSVVPDFTHRFLVIAGLAKHTTLSRNSNAVPTLDEAAWEYFEENKDMFAGLQKLLGKLDGGVALATTDWKHIRSHVSRLYHAVLTRTDFVATTPVAASGRFSKFFQPDIIFVDEASHARELTTLIPLAYFTPKAWIFTGDVKQTQPFVRDARETGKQIGLRFNPFAQQLQLSTMARADHVDAINSRLLINKRAFGNLHRLPSAMFYEGKMISGYTDASRYPESVAHLTKYLQKLNNGRYLGENRIIVNMESSSEDKRRESYWNPVHHGWVLSQVENLLQDEGFRDLRDRETGGAIMIATPYSTAVKEYHAAVKRWPESWQSRVQVLTVDKAQGNEADVVFLDMVRTTTAGFMDDPKRLNVAITRARQGEIIMMRKAMAYIPRKNGRYLRSNYLSQVWDDTLSQNRIVTIQNHRASVM
ncbi:nonsense-mediated mRNA decay protein 1 [Pochonia chlamydosporia 170]|uniref:Nonsense-mediated mRNA decay protein 1 n=1 Tax=Pochonia chlamydosporia 170 TaxID=1380566 RepID=A0A179FSI6_METCM|nr:nonsense-mediated mRNA decay protein 1 [Pochonia chlamydosporia 170]OAQ68585.1 nonsense-mediated mRNA decay protein 1 [Pochonia chlamydosporia 170]